MADFGIVCEFNPLHTGHKFLFDEAKKRGAERIVCVMSGNTVQRGGFAMADKYLRAEAAVRCGADLVLELPFPWSSGSAAYFSRAAVYILRDFADTLIFGSEIADTALLWQMAHTVSSAEFQESFSARTAAGEGAAAVYAEELKKRGFPALGSNDLLAVGYLAALYGLAPDCKVKTVRRSGASYTEREILQAAEFQSAGALRRLWQSGRAEDAARYMPPDSYACFCRARDAGELTEPWRLDAALLALFRLADVEELSVFAECGGGVAQRLCRAAAQTADFPAWLEAARTKCYTDARLRRGILFGATEVTRELLNSAPAYTTLLAASGQGRALLSEKRRSGGIPVVTKPADAPKDSPQFAAGNRADALFTLARRCGESLAEQLKKSAFFS